MKRLIWSAFALSLTLIPCLGFTQTEAIDDFLGIESEVMPDLEGPQKFTPSELYDKPELNVEEKTAIMDKEPLKGQEHSIIPWRGLDPEGFLNIDYWLTDRALKDKTADWKIRLRDQRHMELMGKVLKCVGTCPVFRSVEKANVEHLSRILEGDEFRTDKDSYAWVYLMDGTLLRLGADTSVSFHEMIISDKEIFFLFRLNRGHVYWHPRSSAEVKVDSKPETDTIFLPLMMRVANLEWYERKRFSSQNDREHLNEIMELRDLAIKDHNTRLNAMKKSNNEAIEKFNRKGLITRIMMVTPNVTVTAENLSVNVIHVTGGKSWFRKSEGEGSMTVDLRGYTKTTTLVENPEVWQEVEPTGRSISTAGIVSELDVAELISKRIPTIELAREMWLEKFTLPIFGDMGEQKKLGIEHGYRLWTEDDLKKRQEFLSEYSRRMETTHLRSVENLLVKLEAAGETPRRELNSDIYQKALNHYLLGLKTRYTQKKMRVRELNELEYYVYLLRNGKL